MRQMDAEDVEDENEYQETLNPNEIDSGSANASTEQRLISPEKAESIYEESMRGSASNSLYFNIKKQEQLVQDRLKEAELQNEIEEISIRDLFIKDAVKLTQA